MNATWLKSLIFWIILIVVMFAVFQCSQNSENKKQASALMYERLFHCTRNLVQKNPEVLKHIQQQLKPELTQAEVMKLLDECRQAHPLQSKENYIDLIKSLK
ncbi:hypothetical protein [Acinetobacter sp. CS-2]|uniref:hypothetical protein n=1 Tax=Acinetobacter sp. CS-2 TaxID=2798861 RepID=UPI0019040C8A|nr:hypothetical protein [Acinetobacter sp. CS-2]QQN40360.1 hypothetical protein JFY49_05445 [Acinetobacter sp. CS-2]